jgi:hypothetical protein
MPGGPQYNWIDATDGAPLGFSNEFETTVLLPFNFTYYGVTSNLIRIGDNGAIIFNNSNMEVNANNACPLYLSPHPYLIAVAWDDLGAGAPVPGANIYYKVIGAAPYRIAVVEWHNVPRFNNIGAATFQALLVETTNDILLQYQDTLFGNAAYDQLAHASIGLFRSGTVRFQYSCDQPAVPNFRAIQFYYPAYPATATPGAAPTIAPSPTPTRTATPTRTPTSGPSLTPTRSATASNTPPPTATQPPPTPTHTASPTATASPTPTPPPRVAGPLGIASGITQQPTQAAALAALARNARSAWAREVLPWPQLEPADDAWSFSASDQAIAALASEGLAVFVTLDGTPLWASSCPSDPDPSRCLPLGIDLPHDDPANHYAQFVRALVTRYSGQVQVWQVWHEPNTSTGWHPAPNAADYTRLLRVAYQVVKSVDPSATVVLGGLGPARCSQTPYPCIDTPYLDALATSGAWSYFDASAYRNSMGDVIPESSSAPFRQRLQDFLAYANQFGSKPLWVSEYGWRTPNVNLEQQASYLVRAAMLGITLPGVEKMIAFALKDGSGYAVVEDNGTPKPAYYAFTVMNQKLEGATAISFTNGGAYRRARFTRDGQTLDVFWAASASPYTTTVALSSPATITSRDGLILATHATIATVTEKPVYVEYDLANRPVLLADAYVAESAPAAAYGLADPMRLQAHAARGTSGNCTTTRYSYLKWDLLPLTGNATAVTVTFSLPEYIGANGVVLALYAVADDAWNELTVTWNSRPGVGAQLAQLDGPLGLPTLDFSSPALLAYLNSERSGDGIISLALGVAGCPALSAPELQLSSKEGALAPKLTISSQ